MKNSPRRKLFDKATSGKSRELSTLSHHAFSDYEQFFGLKERPFKGALEAGFFYERGKARDLASILSEKPYPALLYLKGPSGAGKSALLKMLPTLLPDNFVVASLFNPHLKISEALRLGLLAMGQGRKLASAKSEESLLGFFHSALEEMVQDGRHLILTLNEADQISPELLADLKNVLAFEKDFRGHYTVILSGPDDRPWPPYEGEAPHLLLVEPLDRAEMENYVKHRLRAAGSLRNYFSREALDSLYTLSYGLPEMVNQLAERALMAAWADHRKKVLPIHLSQAKASLDKPITVKQANSPRPETSVRTRRPAPSASLKGTGRLVMMGLVLAAILGYFWWGESGQPLGPPTEEAVSLAETPPPDVSPSDEEGLRGGPQAAAPSAPFMPAQLLSLPQGQLALVVEGDKLIGRLWQGAHNGPGFKAEIVTPEIKDHGLYLFGKPASGSPLIFRFPPAKELPKAAARDIWPQVATLLPQNILPVMVADSADYFIEKDEETHQALSSQVKLWVRAQQYRFTDTLASLYASSFQFFEVGRPEKAIKRDEFQKALNSEAKTSGEVSLAISEPLIMRDPANSSLAWAVFNLKYESKLRRDMGARVLVFEKSALSKNTWLIVAELWLPEKNLKDF